MYTEGKHVIKLVCFLLFVFYNRGSQATIYKDTGNLLLLPWKAKKSTLPDNSKIRPESRDKNYQKNTRYVRNYLSITYRSQDE